jgi:hypothetical protein
LETVQNARILLRKGTKKVTLKIGIGTFGNWQLAIANPHT